MTEKVVITGNEAVARGFWEAGGKVSAAYPGSPTVSITDTLMKMKEVDANWATNEKVALEMAIGSSITGARSLCVMKHVGLNIALDPFMTFTQTRTKGAFVLAIGDDPGLTSSQNEQDSRMLAQFANIPVLDPATPQEALDYTREAIRLSEQFETPVMLRIMSRLCHARGVVELNERKDSHIAGFEEDPANFCMLPPYSNAQQYFMKERMENLAKFNETYHLNTWERQGHDTLIITSGLVSGVIKEIAPAADIYKLAMVWPLPVEKLREVASHYRKVLVVEEMMPVMEKELKAGGIDCEGKKFFSFTGELDFEAVRHALAEAGVISATEPDVREPLKTVERTPMLCAGCPHRPVFDSLKKLKATVVGDIGCYSLGILPPFQVHKTNISMGASLGMVLGMAKANRLAGIDKPLVATIGDGTFFHSGLSGMVQLSDIKENITVICMDNRTTAMTGGQKTMTTNELFSDDSKEAPEHYISIYNIVKAMGLQDVEVVDQFQVKEFHKKVKDAMKRPGISVIITTRPCALNFKIVNPPFYVDEKICIGCRSCVNTNCPPINMKKYEGIEALKSHIHADMCVGCSVWSQVCPVGAIKPLAQKKEEVKA
ncbi:MAG: thiamine pyrophosphate-dependent enzyme [Clostridiaceae bacterium]